MRAQRTHETQAERDDHPEEKEGQNQEGPAAFLGKLHDLAGTRNHGTAFRPPGRGMPERSPERKPRNARHSRGFAHM